MDNSDIPEIGFSNQSPLEARMNLFEKKLQRIDQMEKELKEIHENEFRASQVIVLIHDIITGKATKEQKARFVRWLNQAVFNNQASLKQLQKNLDLFTNILSSQEFLEELKKEDANILQILRNICEKSMGNQAQATAPLVIEESRVPTFAVPSHALMFTLLALFAGKPEKIPRKLLEKPLLERTPEEQKKVEEFLHEVMERQTKETFNDDGSMDVEEKHIAIICDNPKVEAKAEISSYLVKDLNMREESLGMYIKRTFGAEGLRHLLGLIIGLEENGRRGDFEWSVNRHLERLGYRREQSGAFKLETKRIATEVIKILTGLLITARRKDAKGKEEIIGKKLFSIDGFRVEMFQKEIIDEILTLRATECWYQNAFESKNKESPKYTKLLQSIAQEDHQKHWLTIYLAPLFTIFWRMNPNGVYFKIKTLMAWCDLDVQDHNRIHYLRELETELGYMKEKRYLGDWKNSGELSLPSECKVPFECTITLYPPDWLKDELQQIETKKKQFLPKAKVKSQEPLISKEEFSKVLEKSGLTINQLADELGISRQMVSYVLHGKRKLTHTISKKIKEKFGNILM